RRRIEYCCSVSVMAVKTTLSWKREEGETQVDTVGIESLDTVRTKSLLEFYDLARSVWFDLFPIDLVMSGFVCFCLIS
ncbi:hypothetical protein A2U01_0037774, partial [Trifolium medium]|nr:hypothetical protein [Trifolium medium]